LSSKADARIMSYMGCIDAVAPAPPGTAISSRWNAADKSTQITLTNSNRTATANTNDGASYGVRTDTGFNDKRYIEVEITTLAGLSALCLGAVNAASSLTNPPAGGQGFIGQQWTGSIYGGPNAAAPTLPAPYSVGNAGMGVATGYILRVAFDVSAGKMWMGIGATMFGDPENGLEPVVTGASSGPMFFLARLIMAGGVAASVTIPLVTSYNAPRGFLVA
jgi:hypothetical protein